jgi:hypothetical protein
MIGCMVSALRRALGRALGRMFACITLLLPFEAMAGDAGPRGPLAERSRPADCIQDCALAPAAQPTWQEALEQFGLLLPKIPQMPSACRPLRQYRSFSLDRMPRQPCYYA